jgi:hypothetical protein
LLGFRVFRLYLISCFFHFLEAENAVENSENKLFSCYHEGVPCDWFCAVVVSRMHIQGAVCLGLGCGNSSNTGSALKCLPYRPPYQTLPYEAFKGLTGPLSAHHACLILRLQARLIRPSRA